MKFGTTFAALTLCISSSVGIVDAKAIRNLKKDKNGKCDLTGMYDIIETATYVEFGIPATDTAKFSLICFDDEDEFDDYACFLDGDSCGGGRRLKTVDESRRLGRKLSDDEDDFQQICFFEAIGFPAGLRRNLKETEEAAPDPGDRKLPAEITGAGVHNFGIALVYDEKIPFGDDGKEKDLCTFYSEEEYSIPVMGVEFKDGIMALRTVIPTEFPYFAHKTTR